VETDSAGPPAARGGAGSEKNNRCTPAERQTLLHKFRPMAKNGTRYRWKKSRCPGGSPKGTKIGPEELRTTCWIFIPDKKKLQKGLLGRACPLPTQMGANAGRFRKHMGNSAMQEQPPGRGL
jgi:hypothetical protein